VPAVDFRGPDLCMKVRPKATGIDSVLGCVIVAFTTTDP